MYLLEKLVGLLPKRARPVAKALVPSVATLCAVGVEWASTGRLDTGELLTALGGVATVVFTWAVPNARA